MKATLVVVFLGLIKKMQSLHDYFKLLKDVIGETYVEVKYEKHPNVLNDQDKKTLTSKIESSYSRFISENPDEAKLLNNLYFPQMNNLEESIYAYLSREMNIQVKEILRLKDNAKEKLKSHFLKPKSGLKHKLDEFFAPYNPKIKYKHYKSKKEELMMKNLGSRLPYYKNKKN